MDNKDNKIEDFFQESEGGGIDDDNLTILGSGEGFDFGSDFVPPPPVIDRDFDRSPLLDNDFDEPDFDIPDLELVPLENPFPSLLDEDAPFPANLQTAINENGLIFDREYYVEQNPELDILPADALSHFEDNVHSNDNLKADTEYRFLLKENGTLRPNLAAITLEYGLPIQSLPKERLVLFFDTEYYLEQHPDVEATGLTGINVFGATYTSHFSEYGISEDREYSYALMENLLLLENAAEDSLSGAGENVVGEQDFTSSSVSVSESEPILPQVKAARMDFLQDYITSGIEGSMTDADLGLGTTSYISSDEIAVEPSNDSFI